MTRDAEMPASGPSRPVVHGGRVLRLTPGIHLLLAALLVAALLLVPNLGSPTPLAGQVIPTEAGGEASEEPPSWPRDLALFAGVLGLDPSLKGAARQLRRSGSVDHGAKIAKFFGNWQSVVPVFAGGSALMGLATEGGTGLKKTVAMLGGVLAGSMANEGLNQAFGRRRPSEHLGAFRFDPFHGHASFPSGHAAFTFSMAASVDAVTEHWFPATVAYTLAGATAASRVHDGDHWVSDVIVGSVVGATVSRWTTRRLMGTLGVREEAGGGKDEGWLVERVRPVATPHFIGVNVRF